MILQSDPSRPFRDASLARLLWDLSDRASYLAMSEPNVEFYLDQFLVGRRVNGPVPDDPGWNQTYVAGSSRIRDLHGVVILPFDEDVQIGVVVLRANPVRARDAAAEIMARLLPFRGGGRRQIVE